MIYTIQYLHPSADVQSCHEVAVPWELDLTHTTSAAFTSIYKIRCGCDTVSAYIAQVHKHVHWILCVTVSSVAQTCSLHGAPLRHHASWDNWKCQCQYTPSVFTKADRSSSSLTRKDATRVKTHFMLLAVIRHDLWSLHSGQTDWRRVATSSPSHSSSDSELFIISSSIWSPIVVPDDVSTDLANETNVSGHACFTDCGIGFESTN